MKRQKQKQNRQRTISNAKADFQFERRERASSAASQSSRPEFSEPIAAPGNSNFNSEESKIAPVQREIEQVVEIMHSNIQKTVQRGENLENIRNKSEELNESAIMFKKSSKQVENSM